MNEENDDKEFEALLADKRHKELKSALNNIAVAMGNKKDDGLKEVLKAHSDNISALVNSISNLPKPEVTVNANNENVATAIKNLELKIDTLIDETKNLIAVISLPKESKIAFNRTYGGYLESPITVTTSIKKIKAQA